MRCVTMANYRAFTSFYGRKPYDWQPNDKVTVEEALRAYISGNVYANFEEDISGTLDFAKRVDSIVLSADPGKVEPKNLDKIKVL